MDQSLVNTLTLQIIDYIVDKVMDPVHGIVTSKVEDAAKAKEINDAIDEHLKGVSGTIPKKAPAATRRSGGSSTSAEVLKDDQGNPIKCEEPTKKGTACRNNAKYVFEGKHLCGTHIKSAQNSQPDSSAKPKKKAPTAPKAGSSTFAQTVGGIDAFSKTDFNVEDDDIPNIGDTDF